MEGKIIVYTGRGEGKTSAAIGHAVRMAGHNKKAVIIHFMKGRKTIGEYTVLKGNKSVTVHRIDIYLEGPPFFLLSKKQYKAHRSKAKEGMELARRIALEKECDLLILDEILYAIKYGLIEENELISLLKKIGSMHVILTGRYCSEKILKMADLVSRVVGVKHYYNKKKKTVRGLDY